MAMNSPPRFHLATLPTPIDEATRLREALGGSAKCPRILIKRDDLTGLAFGGNKARKLEFLVAGALEQRATVLVTTGAEQSNHARMTAAAARIAGLGASLVLTGKTGPAGPPQGNLLLDYLLGAEVRFAADGAEEAAVTSGVMDGLRARGERPYLIPIGGSSPLGALGSELLW
ncbi:MAG: pyridoxal-phosphate dependent enzyme [Acidobacteria bacterium]|nr:pyridoxal-phosphate dependent enzyme [Acidobacteriota bacterium]